ncbi:MAG: hypothetical protein ACYC63_15810 [Armatimonadota bacterium]
MHCLTIDNGTTAAKVAVYALEPSFPRLLHSHRLSSGAGWYDGSPRAVAAFSQFCTDLEAAIETCLAAHPIATIGLTGIREGLVLLDASGHILWVSGNTLLDDDALLNQPISGINISRYLPAILAANPSAHALVSLQGYLAWRLTGHLAITGSELDALGLLGQDTPLLDPVALLPVGAHVGPHVRHPQTQIFLAGTDEQASHHGAGLGATADLGLATATFWSLTAPASAAVTAHPLIRYIPSQPPYCATVSVIGYRFGPYLQQALAGDCPSLPDRLPLWAQGSLLDYLRQTDRPTEIRLLDCLASDIRAAQGLLSRAGTVPPTPTVAVHGGGLTALRPFTTALMERLGYPWLAIEGDATQIGTCLLAQD